MARSFGLLVAAAAVVAFATASCTVPPPDRIFLLGSSVDPHRIAPAAHKQAAPSAKARCAPLNATKLSREQKDHLFQQFDDWQQDHRNDQALKHDGSNDASGGQPSAPPESRHPPACPNAV